MSWSLRSTGSGEYLNTDAEGWISPEVDFGKKRETEQGSFRTPSW